MVQLCRQAGVTVKQAGDNFKTFLTEMAIDNYSLLTPARQYNIWVQYINWLNNRLKSNYGKL